jgi:hypothetical protein
VFIGHFALALGAKRAAPQLSLGTLVAACQLADLAWPVLVLLGIESFEIHPGITAVTPLDFTRYPYSHSLVALALWALAFALTWLFARGSGARAALVLAALVLSHWVLDAVSHRPDMPITIEGSARVGLGLWNSLAATLAVETVLFATGVAIYARTTSPRDRIGHWGLVAFAGLLFVIYLANLFGPPPPGTKAVAWSAIAMWLLVAWAWWLDAHRESRVASR